MKKYFAYFTLFVFFILTFIGCKPERKIDVVNTNSYLITSDYGKRIKEPKKSADYKPISKELSLQYKVDMEQIMIAEMPNVIKKADESVLEAKKLRDNILKNGFNDSDDININNILDVAIPASSMELYIKLMQVTQEKYLKTPYTPIATDHPNAIYYYLYPYFKDNDVSFDTLNKIDNEVNKRYLIVEKYINEISNVK